MPSTFNAPLLGAHERRSLPRFACATPARMVTPVGESLVEVTNLSRSGACIALRSALPVETGMPATLLLVGAPQAQGIVAWIQHGRLGLTLQVPIDNPDIRVDPVEGGRDYVAALLKLQLGRAPRPEPREAVPSRTDFVSVLGEAQEEASELARSGLTRAAAIRALYENSAAAVQGHKSVPCGQGRNARDDDERRRADLLKTLGRLEAQLPNATSTSAVHALRREYAMLSHPDVIPASMRELLAHRLANFNARCDTALARLGAP